MTVVPTNKKTNKQKNKENQHPQETFEKDVISVLSGDGSADTRGRWGAGPETRG